MVPQKMRHCAKEKSVIGLIVQNLAGNQAALARK